MKETRLQEAIKAKKKASKKAASQEHTGRTESSAAAEVEITRLRDREAALMQAVEELTAQNEDLIVKLRESMQRELELRYLSSKCYILVTNQLLFVSSKRAAMVNNSIVPKNELLLPSIFSKESHHEMRSNSEPVDNQPRKMTKKKRK